jgi:CubicO group peptidase (beta-lactamase class C family)
MNQSNSVVRGFCDARFALVREEFERNFAERGEVGGALAIHIDGVPLVDLWGGIANTATGEPWNRDTMVVVFSCTKGMAAVCMHVLIDRGLVEADAPVCRYWPEFAANGKDSLTVAMVMAHQAGLPFWQTSIPPDGLLDWSLATNALAQEPPIWEPGTCHGYHGMTLGYLEGEIVRRVTGKSIGAFLREEIAVPLSADVWIGLPAAEEARMAQVYLKASDSRSPMFRKMTEDAHWIGWQLVNNTGDYITAQNINSRRCHEAEAPAVGGIASARGLARLYAPLARDGSVDSVRVVRDQALPSMRTVRSASACDLLLRVPTTFTLGFSKSWGARSLGPGQHVIMGEHAFGTPGMGGSIGFADGEARMSFGYIMNKHGGGVGLNERGQSLIDAAYQALDFRSSTPGFWVR